MMVMLLMRLAGMTMSIVLVVMKPMMIETLLVPRMIDVMC